jgi:hypothetical protein
MRTSGFEARERATTRSNVTVGDVRVEQRSVAATRSGHGGMEAIRTSLRRPTRAGSIGRELAGRFLTFPPVTYEPNLHGDAATQGSIVQ